MKYFFLSLMMSTILLTACGQSGPLYLPPDMTPHQTTDQTK
ncbi:MAG: lipoprotein [Gammaproteobacteria bacterium]|nr:lipoprotein [Gammaproteobacteria bacterium]